MSVGLKANVDGSGAIQVGGTDAINLSTGLNATFVQNLNAPNTFGFKNRLINGEMDIDQRNAGASVTPASAANNNYTLDRWSLTISQASKFSVQQNAGSVTPPTGFANYFGTTSLSAYSIGTSDYFNIVQFVEGLNCADLAWGTASAATVTLSFWVRSSLTGTFGGSLTNSAGNRSYPFTYTISSANTWEQKSVTIAGDTSGTWLTTNGVGIGIRFGLGVGSTYSGTAGAWAGAFYTSATGATSVVGTNGATFYITGVQLEKGTTATSFDYRDYGRELMMCQRYYQIFKGDGTYLARFTAGQAWATTATANHNIPFIVSMRSAPSLTQSGLRLYSPSIGATAATLSLAANANENGAAIDTGSSTGLTVGNTWWIAGTNTSSFAAFSSEL
jgi:hypothetical protein